MSQEPEDNVTKNPKKPGSSSIDWKWLIVVAAAIVVVALVVVLVLALTSGDGPADEDIVDTEAGITGVTSPYDLHELPADTGPGDVKEASLVSISLVKADGTIDYFGLSADTEPAEALISAVADAEEMETTDTDDSETTDDTDATETTVSDDTAPVSMLTFLFPDRTTLAFELDLEQGTITRGGRVWKVGEELAELVDAAISLHERQ